MKKYNYCEKKSTNRLNNHILYIFICTNMINNEAFSNLKILPRISAWKVKKKENIKEE